jgi:hypothetical protein
MGSRAPAERLFTIRAASATSIVAARAGARAAPIVPLDQVVWLLSVEVDAEIEEMAERTDLIRSNASAADPAEKIRRSPRHRAWRPPPRACLSVKRRRHPKRVQSASFAQRKRTLS